MIIKKLFFIIILIILIVAGLFFVIKKINMNMIILNNSANSEIKNNAKYGEIVKYKKGIAIQFPDFTLTYTGDKLLSGKNGATWSMILNLFEISNEKNTKEVSWSSGTGEIAPNSFEFNGKKYNIEKDFSDKFGQLKQDELIVNFEK